MGGKGTERSSSPDPWALKWCGFSLEISKRRERERLTRSVAMVGKAQASGSKALQPVKAEV